MKVRYQAPKGKRIKKGTFKRVGGKRLRYFTGLESGDKEDNRLWWHYRLKRWVKLDDYASGIMTCNHAIKNVKQAIRHLNKHDEIPKGAKFVLKNRFTGYDVYFTK